ncbi:hypothetical protein Q1695_006639 [Nippostrongylus brasiliensis]|nr:hypothetical protein Q1695_006639 [Nippostrongylus brasiliensis]
MKREHSDDVDDGTVSKHLMSNAFPLQCEESEREWHPDPNVVSKCEALAKKVVSVVKDAKLKHSCQVSIIGESATHLLCSNQFTVTVYLMLPDSLFGKRDYVLCRSRCIHQL